MLKHLKNCLSRIKVSKLSLILIFLFVGFMLLLPLKPAQALIDIDVFSYFTSALAGIEELSNLSTQFVQVILLLFIVSTGFLSASAAMLQWVINMPINIIGNPFVENGWAFSLSLSNLFFILIFVFIALSFILKQDTQDTKKTLIKLIWVAFLVNFSLVFIAMSCDIARFFYNTILGENTNLIVGSIQGLMGGAKGIIEKLSSIIIIWRALYLIPPTAVLAQANSITFIFGLASISSIIAWVLQILFNFIIGGLFVFYSFIFFCRIFVIWFLAVLSPLAFVSLILPETEKHWIDWLKHLSEWLFVGILLLFHLVLGLKFLPAALPSSSLTFPIIGIIDLGDALIYYSAFIVYLSIGIFLAMKNLPSLLETITKTTVGIGKKLAPFVTRPVGGAYRNWIVGEEKARKERKERSAGGERVSRLENLFGGASRVLTTPGRWAYRVAQVSPKESQAKDIKKMEENIKNKFGDDYLGAASTFDQLSPMGKAALIHRLPTIKGEKALNALKLEQIENGIRFLQDFEPDWIKDVAKHKPSLIDENLHRPDGIGNVVRKALVPKGKDDNYVKELKATGMEEAKAIRKAAMKEVVVSSKRVDIEKWSDTMINDPDIQEAILKFRGNVNYIRTIYEEKGQPYIQKLHERYQGLMEDKNYGILGFMKDSPGLVRSTYKNLTFASIFPPVEKTKIDGKEIIIKGIKDVEKIVKKIQKKQTQTTLNSFIPPKSSKE